MRWLPPAAWWLTPSGGPYANPRGFWTVLLEAPLPAHLLGAAAIALALLPFGLSQFQLWYVSVLVMVLWQLFNVERLSWDVYPPWQVVWRVAIGALPLGVVVLVV